MKLKTMKQDFRERFQVALHLLDPSDGKKFGLMSSNIKQDEIYWLKECYTWRADVSRQAKWIGQITCV